MPATKPRPGLPPGTKFNPANGSRAELDADGVMARLEAGITRRTAFDRLGGPRLYALYCSANPEWAARAETLLARNAEAARKRKGQGRAEETHCRNGHMLAGDNLFWKWNSRDQRKSRCCKTCFNATVERGRNINPEEVETIKRAILTGMSIGDITRGIQSKSGRVKRIVGFQSLKRYRLEHPEFNEFILQHVPEQRRRYLTIGGTKELLPSLPRVASPTIMRSRSTELYVAQTGDIEWVYGLTPRYLPKFARDDIAGEVFLELCSRMISRSEVPARVKFHSRKFQPAMEKGSFNSPLSLDAVAYRDGPTLRVETVSRGLWD